MISLRFPVDDDIIADVESARDILELVLNDFLEDLTSWICAEVESCAPPESLLSCKCCDLATFWGKW